MKYCPNGHTQAEGNNCDRCGAVLVPYLPSTGRATGLALLLAGFCITVSLLCIVLGFLLPQTIFQQTSLFALAAVFGIFGRIAQAHKYHVEMMDK